MKVEDFVPLAATGGVSLDSGLPLDEACFVMRESEVERLVTAIENARPSDVFAVIKRQPWFLDVRSGIRQVRHLKPEKYLKLSDRIDHIHRHDLDCVASSECKAAVETCACSFKPCIDT